VYYTPYSLACQTCTATLDVTPATAQPAEITGIQITPVGANVAPSAFPFVANYYSLITINPLVVQDLDIKSGNKIVSSPYPSPSPIMVGQQVQLQVVSANGDPVTVNSWQFDSTSASDVVSNAYTCQCTVVGTPSPVQTGSLNPNTFYWVSGGPKHVTVNATVDGLTLSANVYYQVMAPQPSIATKTNVVQVGYDSDQDGCLGTPPPLTQIRLHVGNACPSPFPTANPGWEAKFSVTVPAFDVGGHTAVAQTFVGTTTGTVATNPQPTPLNVSGLDLNFPIFLQPVGSGVTDDTDAPYDDLSGTQCTSLSEKESFKTFLMYEPGQDGRAGSTIWVPFAEYTWSWFGEAITNSKGVWSLANNPKPINPVATNVTPPTFPTWNARIPGGYPPC
jgi:hypothetical protein